VKSKPKKIFPDMNELFDGRAVVPNKIIFNYISEEHGAYIIATDRLIFVENYLYVCILRVGTLRGRI
jgi:hypothetical protein